MKYGQFLTKNRHGTRWYVRVVIPSHLRHHYHGKRELRKSTGTCDKRQATRYARAFKVESERLFASLECMARRKSRRKKSDTFDVGLITIKTPDGFEFDFNQDTDEEERQSAVEVIKAYGDALAQRPQVVQSAPTGLVPEVPMSFAELIESYRKKRKRELKDKKIRESTYKGEQSKIDLWGVVFQDKQVHEIGRSDISVVA